METIAITSQIKNSFSYTEYRNLVIGYAQAGATSGNEQLSERVAATKINAHRMARIDKQVKLNSTLLDLIKKLKIKLEWIVLAESWCGDGAQNIPVLAKMAEASPLIDLKIILRDEHPEIMNAYLTNGSRSIPKLICLNAQTQEELGTWGPRPAGIQKMVNEYKIQNPTSTHDQFVNTLHLLYARDNGSALQKDFETLLTQWEQQL